ncbi:hypothetical protein ABPG74_013057 [Tetrahymena malaccensis]
MKLIAFLLFVTLVAVNAADQVPKCAQDLQDKLDSGQVCQQGDTDCIAALKSFKECVVGCAVQNSNKQKETASCVQSTCQTSNASVSSFKNDLIKCANSSLIAAFSMMFGIIFLII